MSNKSRKDVTCQRVFTLFNDNDLDFGRSDLATELVEAEMDDDLQTDEEIVEKAKMGLNFDLRDAVAKFCSETTKRGQQKLVKNLL